MSCRRRGDNLGDLKRIRGGWGSGRLHDDGGRYSFLRCWGRGR